MRLIDEVPLSSITRGAKWCPEGNFVLSNQEDARIRVLRHDEENGKLVDHCEAHEGESIYDFTWFPMMQSGDEASMCFFTCSRDHPIHLRDANDGRLRATYRGFNHLDEVSHCYSIGICPLTGTIVGGYKSAVWFFDLSRPGRQIRSITTSTRKGKGPKGIIGAVAPHPTAGMNCLAIGTYHRHIGIYDESGKNPAMLVDREAPMGGITSLMWQNEAVVVSGHRQDAWLRMWDIRSPRAPVARIQRCGKTNQRLHFSCRDAALCFGNDEGMVTITEDRGLNWQAHDSVVVSADVHPRLDLVLTSGGSRVFPNFDVDPDIPLEPAPVTGSSVKLWACG